MKQLPTGVNGIVMSSATPPYKEGDVATIDCYNGYKTGNTKQSVLKLENGKLKWDPPSITCNGAICLPPPYIENEKRAVMRVHTFPEIFSYECEDGYRLNKSRSFYCTEKGSWTPNIQGISCIPVECPELKFPTNGVVIYRDKKYGTKAIYKCIEGFKLVGDKIRICKGEGEWSGKEPSCESPSPSKPQPPKPESPKPQPPKPQSPQPSLFKTRPLILLLILLIVVITLLLL